jgi:uncharacterized protein YuzE
MRLKVDKDGDALYLRLAPAAIKDSEEVRPGVVLDFDEEGRLVGVEILDLSRRVPADEIKTLLFETA